MVAAPRDQQSQVACPTPSGIEAEYQPSSAACKVASQVGGEVPTWGQ